METQNVCQHCHKPLGPKAVQGLCAECFLKVGLGSGTLNAADAAPRPKPSRPFTPPGLEELGAHFPQLEILELVGQGGMGAVYKALQKGLDRLVALKVLPPGANADPSFAERFTREARTLARLSHPSIIAVHDFGQAGGYFFFLMEFVDGLNLRQLLAAQRLSPKEALAIIPQICEALQYAHDRGVVHRDIKPENLLIDKSGRVKIADFGLAKLLGAEPPEQRLTEARDVMGTPHYMAPEQIERPQTVDHRADIYSLGVVFYEMLTGELPLGRFAPPSQKVQMDVRLDEVVLRALEKEPARRYQQASQIKTEVQTITSSAPPPPPSAVPPQKQGRGLRFALAGGVALALLAAAIVKFAFFSSAPALPPSGAATPDASGSDISLETAPPVVVRTVPVAGSTEVDPALPEIRVTFSKPMLDNSWSWSTFGPEYYPKTTGSPHYVSDRRTCVLPVQLQPGHTYAFWLNSGNFNNFQDAALHPAAPYLLVFRTKK